IATLMLFIGATGKSAQIPLFVWLPDAMEGPTPVSALIHAATMVTAGVYMIGRNAVLFGHAPLTLAIVALVGTATALIAGAIAIAGVPPFAGFYSKDEILFRSFASGHTLLWAVGLLTALLTACYMFRLVFMTFHGPSFSAPHASPAHSENPANPVNHLHDAP